jgi:hypothetical protein
MNGKTEWFTSRHKPVRPGVYECVVDILEGYWIMKIRWHPYRGWLIEPASKIKMWRGLTVEEFMKRGGR